MTTQAAPGQVPEVLTVVVVTEWSATNTGTKFITRYAATLAVPPTYNAPEDDETSTQQSDIPVQPAASAQSRPLHETPINLTSPLVLACATYAPLDVWPVIATSATVTFALRA